MKEMLPQKLFVVRMEGFTPISWPVFSLPRHKRRSNQKSLNELQQGLAKNENAAVLYCGTSKANADEKYKILGLAYCSPQLVNTDEHIAQHCLSSDRYDEWGFKFPKGFQIIRAEIFKKPLQSSYELLGKNFVDGISRIKFGTLTNMDVIQQVMSIERDIIVFPTGKGNVDFKKSLAETNKRVESSQKSAFAYIFRFGRWKSKNCFKIGFTNDIKRRYREFCNHVPSEVLKEQWKFPPFWKHKFKTENEARLMERLLLNTFSDVRTKGERILCERMVVQDRLERVLESYGLPSLS